MFNISDYSVLAENDVIYNFIKPNSTVLDLGCGNGGLGGHLRRNKNCRVCGLEADKKLAEAATRQLDSVVCEDIKDIHKISFETRFDYIVCADILEHILDPGQVLHDIKNLLAEDGYLLVSVPNIANWRIRVMLLSGRFQYRPLTITDPGHIRFYTRDTARAMLESAGYRIDRILPKNSAYKKDWMMRLLGKLWGNMFAYQFVFIARPMEK